MQQIPRNLLKERIQKAISITELVILHYNLNHSMDIDRIIEEASVKENLSITSGLDFWHTNPLPHFPVLSIKFSDRANGFRGSKFFASNPGLCIPCGSGLGATWNKSLLVSAGSLLSKECKAKGVHVWLAPTLHRSPLNVAKTIEGVQSGGTAALLKHFVANDQETGKRSVDLVVSERALRESYLMTFMLALKHGKPDAMLTSYNKMNGVHVSESSVPIQQAQHLRQDSIWKCPVHACNAQAMPSLLSQPKVSAQEIASKEGMRNFSEDKALNRNLATESIVLLKNENGIPPLSPDSGSLALMGLNVKDAAACGGGSAIGFIFGAVGVCALIFSFFCVPECKERTMEQVDRMIIESVPLRRFRDHVIADADHAGLEKDKENLGIEVRRVEIV
ncbi:putative beta-glucosidase H [Drepanopeziza brunnea f. sp. 'multigermtubi' MB_m1]|uniref:beta-glucosidase n=1 Tax=Marssonina brunnea f. sp. multigermtubi (strain MB_m1) TaxID=1072389 RepID=K1XT62_MARBU|nr:putative beta-glucosidase H [Drepanopeziza brunnea f. sp. 'multigermtubi' MB_m1]EKD15649.1 putative beta-glucosidase H [Drepanopeziza brunnea f. sp. 'multigermtubi' MB_m1]